MVDSRLSRRTLLASIAATAGLAGCAAFSSPENTATSSEATTPSSTATGTPTMTQRSPTAQPQHPTTPEQVAAARNGHVVPVAAGLGEDASVDPMETDTPVSDAFRRIDETGEDRGFGAVLLPPDEITEAAPIVPSQYTSLLGWGVNTSRIEFTDLEADGIRIRRLNDGKFVRFDGFTLVGSGEQGERRGGSAIHFDNGSANPRHFNIGSLSFRNWVDPVVHLERGAPFGCVWQHLDFGFGENDGREIVFGRNQSFLGSQIGYISAGNRTGDPVITTDFSGARFNLGFLNIGGSAGPALDLQTTWNGYVSVNGINYETGTNRTGTIVAIDGPASTRIEHVKNTNSTVDSIARLGRRNAHNVIGRVQNAGTVRRGKIEITDQPAGPSFYFGSSSDFATDIGSMDDYVWALGDMTTADGRRTFSASSQPQAYTDPQPEDLATGEFAVAWQSDNSPALVYCDQNEELYFWRGE
jgi:hypothetical protein